MPTWLKNKKVLRILLIGVLLVVYYITENPNGQLGTSSLPADNHALNQAIDKRISDVQVVAEGNILKVLPDDNKGSRHQRFLVKLPSNNVILIAHNIDLAPKVPGLDKGEKIRFAGEFEWNDKGGVVHWTHHDPRGKHVDGWLEYRGQRYQ